MATQEAADGGTSILFNSMAERGISADAMTTLSERIEDLARIAKLDQPIIRNLLITQRYHDLSHELAKVLGPSNANWSTFATWASKTAGRSIREQQVPRELVEFLEKEAKLAEWLERFYKALGPLRRFAPKLDPFDLARAIIQEVATQIADGNLRVFVELAPLFADFSDAFAVPATRTPQALDEFLKKLAPGPSDRGGQDALNQAFGAYFAASLGEHEVQSMELILLGNALIGLHEQTRLQQNIARALDAPFSERVYERFGAAGPKFLHGAIRALIRAGVRFFARELLDDWQRVATRFLMKLSAPNGEDIPLGKDLPPERFDPLLTKLSNRDLISFLERFDKDLDSTRGSAAVNWTILRDRMKFIGELFRVSQRDPSWFDQPFDAQQRLEIEAGRVPPGKL